MQIVPAGVAVSRLGCDIGDIGSHPCPALSTLCSSSLTTHMDSIMFESIHT